MLGTYAVTDVGSFINATIEGLPSTGGIVIIPSGTHDFSTPIVIDRPIKLIGEVGSFAGGTVLNWIGGLASPITIKGSAYGAVLENFTLTGSSATVGIDVINGQYDVVLRHVTVGNVNTVAGIRLGSTGSPVINTKLYNVRIHDQPVGLQILSANVVGCYSCSIYNCTVANVQIGDSTHSGSTAVNFFDGNVEQDSITTAPNFLVIGVQGLGLFGLYAETMSGPHISVPNNAVAVNGIRSYGGRINCNGQSSNIVDTHLAGVDVAIDGLMVVGAPSGSNLLNNGAGVAMATLANILAKGSSLTMLLGSPTNVTVGTNASVA